MTTPFLPRVGGTLSADIAVPEHERVVRFYTSILTTGQDPLWREDLMNNVGMPIIGLGERVPEYEALPMQWMPHILVADVAASAARAVELGGSELMHGKDDEGNSQWAVLVDPDGAAFGIIPVASAEGAAPADLTETRVGRIAWLDLTVPDAAASRDFYQAVIGWSAQDAASGSESEPLADVTLLGGDGTPAAGIRRAHGAHQDLPPVWLLHLPVADLAESLRRAKDHGGQVLQVTDGPDGEPERAVIQDPVGVHVALVPG